MKRQGIPYQGSKNAIAAHIVGEFLHPSACLVDIFAGGCAVTHAALEAGWHKVISNDISDVPELFAAAARGEYKNEKNCPFFTNMQKNYGETVRPASSAQHVAEYYG